MIIPFCRHLFIQTSFSNQQLYEVIEDLIILDGTLPMVQMMREKNHKNVGKQNVFLIIEERNLSHFIHLVCLFLLKFNTKSILRFSTQVDRLPLYQTSIISIFYSNSIYHKSKETQLHFDPRHFPFFREKNYFNYFSIMFRIPIGNSIGIWEQFHSWINCFPDMEKSS